MSRIVKSALSLLVFVLAIGGPIAAQATVTVHITTDNAYAFGFGDVNGVTSTLTWVENCTAGEIVSCTNGPETYTIGGSVNLATAYIYIAAWSDDTTKQGALASFTDGTNTVNSGLVNNGVGPQWEVYATGEQMDISSTCTGDGCAPTSSPGPPTVAGMNGHISTANTGSLWQNAASGYLAFGDKNDGTGTTYTGQTCPSIMPSSTQWMWRNPDPANINNPFVIGGAMTCGTSEAQEYLIFRIGPIGPILATPTSGGGKAKQYKISMVRAYSHCGEAGGPTVNTTMHGGAVPACAPPAPLSSYSYEDCKGQCIVQIDRKPLVDSCDCKIKAQCKGILDPTLALINSTPSGFQLQMTWRETGSAPAATSIPIGISLPMPNAGPGKLKLKTTCNEFWASLGLPPMSTGSSVEIYDVAIIDPDNNPFVVPGINCCGPK